jgi:hypothetical protein
VTLARWSRSLRSARGDEVVPRCCFGGECHWCRGFIQVADGRARAYAIVEAPVPLLCQLRHQGWLTFVGSMVVQCSRLNCGVLPLS